MGDNWEREELTQAELARKHGISRSRGNQWLALLKLPEGERKRFLAMVEHWERRVRRPEPRVDEHFEIIVIEQECI